MRIKILILIIIVLYSNVHCQKISVSGLVKDAETGDFLPYTNIQVMNTNYGTVSNNDGQFRITLDSASYTLTFSLIGYASKSITIGSSQKTEIDLQPISYMMGEVVANSLTWAEKFILEAIKKNEKRKKKLHYYIADAYSKTTFSTKSLGIFGLSESISRIQFLEPDLHKEKLIVHKVSPNLKSIPYEAIAINQSINLLNQSSKAGNFFIINPLSQNTFEYYDFYLKDKTNINGDTVVVLNIIPKKNNIPLFEGELYFLIDTHQLIEANLSGNQNIKNATFDSLKLYQKYSLKDSIFNLPSFTKFSMRMNFAVYKFVYQQEYTIMNYSINKEEDKPFIVSENRLNKEPNLNIDLDFKRDELFKVPLTDAEEKFNKKMEDIFINAPFYRRFLMYVFSNFFPFIFDQPSTIAEFNFTKFSNLYRFNKVEGHYLGFEYSFFNTDNINLYSKAGYATGADEFEFDLRFRWKQLSLNFNKSIRNLGGFEYVQSLHTLKALFYHKDDLDYLKSTGAELRFLLPLSSRIILTPFISIEEQKPISNSTEFSIFKKEERYKQNYQIPAYSNNTIGLSLEYIENTEFSSKQKQLYRGQSFTNVSASVEFGNKDILKSTENATEWNIEINRYQEIYNPFTAELQLSFRYLNNTDYINKMNFVNSLQALTLKKNLLTFYTLNNYDYYLENYVKIKGDLTFFNLPQIFGFQISFGGLYTFLRPLSSVNLETSFQPLSVNFYEYGLSLKGISFLNIYFLKNNINPKYIYIRTDFSF